MNNRESGDTATHLSCDVNNGGDARDGRSAAFERRMQGINNYLAACRNGKLQRRPIHAGHWGVRCEVCGVVCEVLCVVCDV
jgi:hypothetical protein